MTKSATKNGKKLCIYWARSTLGSKIRRVEKKLSLAAFHPEDNREYVHQLRVATRQAMACIQFFSPFFKPRQRQQVYSLLRRIRKAAGDARDLDVFLDNHPQSTTDDDKRLVKLVQKNRTDVQIPLLAIVDELNSSGSLTKSTNKLFSKLNKNNIPSSRRNFNSWIRKRLQTRYSKVFRDEYAHFKNLTDAHRFRIACKELRYTLEMLSDFGNLRRRKKLLNSLSDLQDRLGDLNDLSVACKRLRKWTKKQKGATRRLLKNKLLIETERLRIKEAEITSKKFAKMTDRVRKRFELYISESDKK